MVGPVVTVDFHNTLIECDEWFHLEVRTLVSAVLDWASEHAGAAEQLINRQIVDDEYRRLRLAIHSHGHELEAERAVAVVLDRVGISLAQDVIAAAVHELMHGTLRFAQPVAGARQFLQELHQQNARIAVVSSAVYHQFLEWALESFSMLNHVNTVITSASCGFYKSRPEIYWAALAALDTASHGAAHVGNSLRFDVGGASAAGMKTVWYDRAPSTKGGTQEFIPDLIVTDLESASEQVLALTRANAQAPVAIAKGNH